MNHGRSGLTTHTACKLCLSSTNETTQDASLSSCSTGTYISRLRPGILPPSDAVMPCESAPVALGSMGGGIMADNIDILNTAVSLLVRAALPAARFSRRVQMSSHCR